MTMPSLFADMTSSPYFWRCHVSLITFSFWSKFYVNIITGSGGASIFICKRLTRNPEVGNTHVWICQIPGDWSKVGMPNLTQISLIKFYWPLQNVKVSALIVSELFMENQQGVKLPPPRLRLNINCADYCCIINGISKNEVVNLLQKADLNKKSGT